MMQLSLWFLVLMPFGYISSSGVAGSQGKSISSFKEWLYLFLPVWCMPASATAWSVQPVSHLALMHIHGCCGLVQSHPLPDLAPMYADRCHCLSTLAHPQPWFLCSGVPTVSCKACSYTWILHLPGGLLSSPIRPVPSPSACQLML